MTPEEYRKASLRCLVSVYIKDKGHVSGYAEIDPMDLKLGLQHEDLVSLADRLVNQEQWLDGSGGKLGLSYEGMWRVEETIHDWIGRKPNELSDLKPELEQALPTFLKRAWERFCVQAFVYGRFFSADQGWVAYEEFRQEFGPERFGFAFDALIAKGILVWPETNAATFTEFGREEFEDQLERLKALGLPESPSFEQFRVAYLQCHQHPEPTREYRGERVPTPEGSAWGDLEIRFRGPETLIARIGKVQRTYNFAQLGMVDRRDATPDKQWQLLYDLSDHYGTLTWTDSGASPRVQKRRERLAETLQAVFGIQSDPIEWIDNGWKTKFRMEPS